MRKLRIPIYNELYNVVYNYTVLYIIDNNEDAGCYLFSVIINEVYCVSELYNKVYTPIYNDIYYLLHTKS